MKELIDKAEVVAEIERLREEEYPCDTFEESTGYYNALDEIATFLNTLEVKEVDYERELSKYVSNGIHRFFPNVDDDYCKMDSVIWQDYVIDTAKHFFELELKAQKGE